MITWTDHALLLSVRPHGESAALIDVLSPEHGRHAGIVRGGTGRRLRPVLMPGAELQVTWSARLQDHLGTFTAEPLRSRAATLEDGFSLAGLTAVLALLSLALPERQAHPGLHARSGALLDLLPGGGPEGHWPLAYLQWEMALLAETGFGLDLSACAVTGSAEDLTFVSPRTGRAVSRTGAGGWADRLLPLPPVLLGKGPMDRAEILQGLAVTGHFLLRLVTQSGGPASLPAARARLLDRLAAP